MREIGSAFLIDLDVQHGHLPSIYFVKAFIILGQVKGIDPKSLEHIDLSFTKTWRAESLWNRIPSFMF